MDTNNSGLSKEFLRFLINIHTLIRKPSISSDDLKTNSHSFILLYILKNYNFKNITMSELANKLQITKQQLTKLVNELEKQNYVERKHDLKNRRQVYIYITQEGYDFIKSHTIEIINNVTKILDIYNTDEKNELYESIQKINKLLKKL